MSLAQRHGARRIDDDDLVVTIDRSDDAQRYRYVCPNGHIDWDRTNNHVWCRGCRRRIENGDDAIDAEHYEILDKRKNRLIPWDQVFVE
jgi:hypothetical protein